MIRGTRYSSDFRLAWIHPDESSITTPFDTELKSYTGKSRSIALSTTSQKIADGNDQRKTLVINNESLTIAVHIALGNFPASANTYRIPAAGGYEFNATNPYYGPVFAMSESGTPSVSIMEW